MPKNNGKIIITEVVISAESWTPIIAPTRCNSYVLYNSIDLRLRTDTDDHTSEMVFVAGTHPSLLSGSTPNSRFLTGEIIIFARWAAGSGSSTLKCVFVL